MKSFYSPIPELASLPDDVWDRRSELRGIRFDLGAQLSFLESELAPFLRETSIPANPSYGPVDAVVLHAMIRHLKPSRIVELGSGHTTLVIADACAANEREGNPSVYRAYDPFPAVAERGRPGLTELHRLPAQQVPDGVFAELSAGDVLFVDTTHTVKLGGDVNRVVLDVLPALAPGVVVHFHDVFLPWEYPRRWAEDYGLFWSEQYMLQAFLTLNDEFDVVCALYALTRAYPERLRDLVPSWGPGSVPGAFWIRRRAPGRPLRAAARNGPM